MNDSSDSSRGDTLFRCPTCHIEKSYRLRDVLLGTWPECATCQGTPMRIVETQTTVSAAYDQAVTPIIKKAGEALRELNQGQ
jgi:hypothetical protein